MPVRQLEARCPTQLSAVRADGAMDAMSFMEFQVGLRGAQLNHISALKETQRFWKLMLKKEMSFRAVATRLR